MVNQLLVNGLYGNGGRVTEGRLRYRLLLLQSDPNVVDVVALRAPVVSTASGNDTQSPGFSPGQLGRCFALSCSGNLLRVGF
jgi:hypothetical protein